MSIERLRHFKKLDDIEDAKRDELDREGNLTENARALRILDIIQEVTEEGFYDEQISNNTR